jgi:hypothetical protein
MKDNQSNDCDTCDGYGYYAELGTVAEPIQAQCRDCRGTGKSEPVDYFEGKLTEVEAEVVPGELKTTSLQKDQLRQEIERVLHNYSKFATPFDPHQLILKGDSRHIVSDYDLTLNRLVLLMESYAHEQWLQGFKDGTEAESSAYGTDQEGSCFCGSTPCQPITPFLGKNQEGQRNG